MDSILVVEDNPTVLHLMVEVLVLYGYKVRPFRDADHAWDHIANRDISPRLVITDLRMPGEIDGAELVRRIHQLDPDVPIVIVTGMHEAANSVHDKQVFWLHKPFDLDALHTICQQLVPVLGN